VGSVRPSSAQYKVDVLLSSSSQDGLGAQHCGCDGFQSQVVIVFLCDCHVVMFPEYEDT